MRGNKKKPEEFTSTDLYRYWTTEYKKHKGTVYNPAVSIMYDQRLLKSLIDNHYDSYGILLAIKKAIINDTSTVRYFVLDFDSYVPDTDFPDIEYNIRERGDSERKKQLKELHVLEAKWFPNASDRKRKEELIRDLRDWLD